MNTPNSSEALTPTHGSASSDSGLRWHKLTALAIGGEEFEVMGATCIDGIGVIVRWKRNAHGWSWEAIDTEGGVDWSPADQEEGCEIPGEPPAVWDDLPQNA